MSPKWWHFRTFFQSPIESSRGETSRVKITTLSWRRYFNAITHNTAYMDRPPVELPAGTGLAPDSWSWGLRWASSKGFSSSSSSGMSSLGSTLAPRLLLSLPSWPFVIAGPWALLASGSILEDLKMSSSSSSSWSDTSIVGFSSSSSFSSFTGSTVACLTGSAGAFLSVSGEPSSSCQMNNRDVH